MQPAPSLSVSPTSSSSNDSFIIVDMDSQHSLPFVVGRPTNKRSVNLCRWWRSLSTLQRNIISVALVLTIFSCTFLAVSLPRAKLEPQHRKEEQTSRPRPQTRIISPKDTFPSPNNSQAAQVPPVPAQEVAPQDSRQLVEPRVPKFKGPENDRQKAIVDAFKHAWNGYKMHAWGKDHLKPVSKSGHDWFGLGLTIVDSLDTMIVMGLEQEFEEAKEWVSANLNFDKNTYVNLFETSIRVLGGLLSAFHLSGDNIFKEKALDLGQRLTGAFDSPSKVPYSDVNLQSRKGKMPVWGSDSSLSEVSTIQLEFRDLSRVTGNPVFERLSYNVSWHIHRIGCSDVDGLCPMFISPKTGNFKQKQGSITFGARSDSYYEYLLKQWLQTGKTITWLKEDYVQAMQSMSHRLLRYSEPSKLTFVGELIGDKTFSPKMDHLVCFLAGTLALGTVNGLPAEHMNTAKELARTCYKMYEATATGLGPEIAHFNMLPGTANDITIKPLDAHSLLRPEAIEAWFYLYRLTGDPQYQEWGWAAFEAIQKYAKVGAGYSSVQNAKKIPVVHRDMQESFFLSETLKYLYLLFGDDQTLLSLSEFVFNTEGHPLPIYKS